MELLFVALGGAILGIAARYLFRHRETHGVILVPAIGVGVSAVVWVALTWLGMKWDGGWIWVITFAVTALAVGLVSPLVGIYRERSDIAQLVKLRAAPGSAVAAA
jgi:ABC-type branched-subunit amino acid transport system permease subunit